MHVQNHAARDSFEEHQVNVAITAYYGAGQ